MSISSSFDRATFGTGTFGDVDLLARRLAAALRARGVGPGDVVAFQLPNWVEAAATFWASAFLSAVIVPIVHFYGPREVGFILTSVKPRVFVTAESFGRIALTTPRSLPMYRPSRWSDPASMQELVDTRRPGGHAGGRPRRSHADRVHVQSAADDPRA